MRIGLVACCKAKQVRAMAACELYISPLFMKAAAYCSTNYDCWFILSAKYGLVHPDTVIAPYDCTLRSQTSDTKRRWGEGVISQLATRGFQGENFFIHAGREYWKPLLPFLHAELPLKGLGIGQQLRWYIDATRRTAL